MEGGDTQLLMPPGYILGSQLGSEEKGLILVILHLHPPPPSHTADGFLARKIGDMDKSVIGGCTYVADTKHIFFLQLYEFQG